MKIFILLLVLAITGESCPQDLFKEANQDKVSKSDIVATIDSINITAEEFFYSYEFGPAFPKRTSNSKETHLKYMINEKLLALDGYGENVMDQDYARGIFNDIKSDLAAEELFREELLPKVEVTENEIDKIIEKKLSEYEIRWLFSKDQDSIDKYNSRLMNGISFDTLFNEQLNDSVFKDDRSLKSSLFTIYTKNPLLAQILDTLKAGAVSIPIHTNDGWYIIKIDNVWKNLITSETEQTKLRSEAVDALKQSKMGIKSDEFVKDLFDNEKPVIKRDVFNFLRSYIGKSVLPAETYSEWGLEMKLDSALSKLGLKRGDKNPGLILVTGTGHNYSLDDFLIWYRDREEYVKFSKENLKEFSVSLENLVWLMVRDKLLAGTAEEKGYNDTPWVKIQSNWWRDKIAYGVRKNELAKSITLTSDELNMVKEKKKSESDILDGKLSAAMLHTILKLKSKYRININQEVLSKIKVSSENDKKAIDMYIIKRGNLIPRTVFPSIDNEWAAWE